MLSYVMISQLVDCYCNCLPDLHYGNGVASILYNKVISTISGIAVITTNAYESINFNDHIRSESTVK